jgi:hypothetical protein
MLQVALVLVGLVYVAMIYPLYIDLAHSKWLLEMKNACDPMFLSWFIALGPFLLLAARKPSLHRSLITFAACQALAHASVMTIQSMEARRSSEFYGCCPVRRHRGNFAGTHTGKTKAERSRYPMTAGTSLFHSRPRLLVVPIGAVPNP